MRLERITPLTMLLAAAAVLACAVLGAALAGWGRAPALLPADPSLVQPLPDGQASTAGRLGGLTGFASVTARPLFARDRRPHPFVLDGRAAEATGSGFDYRLTSVLLTPELQMAIVTPTGGGTPVRMRLDQQVDEVPGWKLVELAPESAVFEGPQGRELLELQRYDGGRGAIPLVLRERPVPARSRDDPMDAMDVMDATGSEAAMDADGGGGGGGDPASAVKNP